MYIADYLRSLRRWFGYFEHGDKFLIFLCLSKREGSKYLKLWACSTVYHRSIDFLKYTLNLVAVLLYALLVVQLNGNFQLPIWHIKS